MSCQGNAVLSLIAGAIKGCVFADIVLVKKVNGKTLTVFPLVTGTNASGGSIENRMFTMFHSFSTRLEIVR
jgi:hypothetical protein